MGDGDSDDKSSGSALAGVFDGLFEGEEEDPFAGAELDVTVPDVTAAAGLDVTVPDLSAALAEAPAAPSLPSPPVDSPLPKPPGAELSGLVTGEIPLPKPPGAAAEPTLTPAPTPAAPAPKPAPAAESAAPAPAMPFDPNASLFEDPAAKREEPTWYVGIGDEQIGPLTETQLSERWDRGDVSEQSLVWREGQADWLELELVMDLRHFVRAKLGMPEARAPRELELGVGDPSVLRDPDDPALPFEQDPFAAEDDDALERSDGSWRPSGMTEVYQAAADADEDELPAEAPFDPAIPERTTSEPEQMAALANLAEEESSSGRPVPGLGPLPGLAPGGDPGLPAIDLGLGAAQHEDGIGDLSDPFAPKILNPESEIAHIAGQSSLVRPRVDLLADDRRFPLPLMIGVGGGAVVIILIAIVLVVALRDPKPADADPATGGAALAEVGGGGAAEGAGKDPAGDQGEAGDDQDKGDEGADTDKVERDPRCDPLLYPDGKCPAALGDGGGETKTPLKDELAKEDILKTVRSHQDQVDACADAQRKRKARLATGTLKVQWYVRPDGRTKNVAVISAKHKGTHVGDCVADAVKEWRFPAFRGDEVGPIKFPFSLDD